MFYSFKRVEGFEQLEKMFEQNSKYIFNIFHTYLTNILYILVLFLKRVGGGGDIFVKLFIL